MDELYVESFSKRSSSSLKKPPPPVKEPLETPSVELYEVTNQMSFYVEQLEKAIFRDCANFSDFHFILEKIKTKLNQKNTEGIAALLEELEDLLDLS
jgi:hypothetical protein